MVVQFLLSCDHHKPQGTFCVVFDERLCFGMGFEKLQTKYQSSENRFIVDVLDHPQIVNSGSTVVENTCSEPHSSLCILPNKRSRTESFHRFKNKLVRALDRISSGSEDDSGSEDGYMDLFRLITVIVFDEGDGSI